MKNNTLAIALGALLLGGVATAGFLNNRDKANDIQVPADGDTAQYTDAYGEPLPDNAIPASGRLEYAEVVGVEPVIEREKMYATVIGTEPVRESSTTSTPQQVCEDVVVAERMPERDGNVGGTVAGAVIGGLIGNQIGGGDGRKAATVGGAVAGGRQWVSWVDLDDIIAAMLRAIDQPAMHGVYHVTSPNPVRNAEIGFPPASR